MDSTYDGFNAAEAAMAESRIKILDLTRQLAAANEKLAESARLATESAQLADGLAKDLAAAHERAGGLEELRKDAWAMLLAIASGNGPFEKKMTRADMMEAARQSAEALEVPDAL